jgi:hypothetical protein
MNSQENPKIFVSGRADVGRITQLSEVIHGR